MTSKTEKFKTADIDLGAINSLGTVIEEYQSSLIFNTEGDIINIINVVIFNNF